MAQTCARSTDNLNRNQAEYPFVYSPKITALILLLLTLAGANASEDLQAEAFSALESATRYFRTVLSCRGGYLGEYKDDLSVWIGESHAQPNQIWVQPPGTPRLGLTFLRAYEATDDRRYLEAAIAVADALIWGQLEPGGWHYVIDFLEEDRVQYRHEDSNDPDERNTCVFDDNVSQEAIRLLMAVDGILQRDPYHEATMYALEFMMKSQFANGAWPQMYPLTGEYPEHYPDYYTFNDQATNDCISVMMEAYIRYGDERYLRSAESGGGFIIISQIEEPQGGWAQQYFWNLTPAPARAFEPAAACSKVTGHNIRTLLELYLLTGNETYLSPIPSAIDWFDRSTIGQDLWARFYELGTNRPIYGDRDGEIYYNLSDISEERRLGYSWTGAYGRGAKGMYKTVMEKGREGYLADRHREPTEAERLARASDLESDVREAIDSLDPQGRWIEDGWIYSRTFNRLAEYLIDYLHYTGWNATVPVPSVGQSFSASVTPADITLGVEVKGSGSPISRVSMRFTPPTSLVEYGLRDDGQGADSNASDSIYTVNLEPDPEAASSIHRGVVVADDSAGHWNLTTLPVGSMAAASLALVELETGLAEALELKADTTAIDTQRDSLRHALGEIGPDTDMERILADLESLVLELEDMNVASLIEVASDVIERARDEGIDVSRHEIFLGQAQAQYDKGNYGPARQFLDYPLSLHQTIPEVTAALSLCLLVTLVDILRRRRR
jgi:PelA/Pel-15E family pectate lyase